MSALLAARPKLFWLRLRFDRSLDPSAADRAVTTLVSSRSLDPLVLEAARSRESIVYRVGTTRPGEVRSLLRSALPSVTVTETDRSVPLEGVAWELRSNTRRRALNFADVEGATERILGALAVDGAVHQVRIGRRLRPTAVPNQADGFRAESVAGSVIEAATSGVHRHDPELRRAMAAKQGVPGAEVTIRLFVPGARRHAAGRYVAAMRSLESPGLRLRLQPASYAKAVDGRSGRKLALNAVELTAVTAWPFGERNYPQLDRAGSRVLPILGSRSGGRLIGDAVHPATTGPVGITAGDGLRHTWLLGPTGVGKSTVIEHLALQDIEAGRGVVVIDPKGDLVEGLLARIPDKHTGRVVVVDPARTDQVVGFNPLAVRSGSRELAADNVLHVIKSLNRESWGPRTQDILHAALLTLASSARPSLVLVPQLLIDQQFRDNLLTTPGSHGSPALATFWQWFVALSDAERSAVIAPVLNKLRPFTMRSSLRAMLGQTQPSFDLASVFTRRRVVLMPLRRGLIGSDAANLVGALLLSQLWQQAQHRARLDPADRFPVFVYLDEFQDYLALPTDLTDVLAQARGLGVGLVLAHQHLAQLSPDVRAAVAANAQNQIVFRLQGDDATAIAKRTNALDTVDFTSLRAFSAYAAILEGGQRGEYGSIRTRPPRPALRNHRQLADALAAQWGTPPSAVDDALYGQAGYRRNGDLGDENGDGGWPVGSRPRRPT